MASMFIPSELRPAVEQTGPLTLARVPDGFDALLVADFSRMRAEGGSGCVCCFVARDDAHAAAFSSALAYFAPTIEILQFPAWDCLPYDRVSPKPEIVSERMATLSRLAQGAEIESPLIIVTTANAVLQRTPPKNEISAASFQAHTGNLLDVDRLMSFLNRNGYSRVGNVMEAGEFAVRGGIIDLFPPGEEEPIRLDLFGDTLESIRCFDPQTQKSTRQRSEVFLVPASEAPIEPDTIARFRSQYVKHFGAVVDDDELYVSISEGRKYPGMEHWLPLFHASLSSFVDYIPETTLFFFDHQLEEAVEKRFELIEEYYEARREGEHGTGSKSTIAGTSYKPLPPDLLYLQTNEWEALTSSFPTRQLSPFAFPDEERALDIGAKQGRTFAAERSSEDTNVFTAVADHVRDLQSQGKRVLIAAWTEGSADRTCNLFKDHGVDDAVMAIGWHEALGLKSSHVGVTVLPIETGFETTSLAIISEQDILGDRLIRKQKRSRRAANFISEVAALSEGDLVVHVDHGIGRYTGLKTIDVSGAPHDCALLEYAGGDKLYLPVENIELLSRFGSEDHGVQLDKLGGAGWQSRKAKLKNRIREMAAELIKIAAARELRQAAVIELPAGQYEEFSARFPFDETDDQLRAIDETVDDLSRGRPMDRLICGDVGFGKTEVALRVAFMAVMKGLQVAVVTPTTLLARQHYKTFSDRFKGWPVTVRQLSRLVNTGEASETREGMANGQVDVVIGTHALLAKKIQFKELGLIIVDEEQRFGVAHKERLKQLRQDVHVLTLTATPIPRTLQLAMTGIRDLSLIATPPVDRLAVRSFVTPFDPVIVREALLREKYRGGQSFYVCPRIADLGDAQAFLEESVPEVSFQIAHGQMPKAELEDVMSAFYDGKFDVLISTTIVESGLDVPAANTLIIHRADMFGLAQLYQLRGRVGRSKARAYAYFTVPSNRKLTDTAEKRLKVLQSLDTLGAGFTLASHDLDIRGAGNLLGEEQSGHIREVGVELYQNMLEEAVAALRVDPGATESGDQWSPQINLGTAVLIPENYVEDLDLRLGLYRRLSNIEEKAEIDGFASELIDRFGPLPDEVNDLLKIVEIKSLCRRACVEKIDAGPKGATLSFRNTTFTNPMGLIEYISQSPGELAVRPDQTLVYKKNMPESEQRLMQMTRLLEVLVDIAEDVEQAA